MLVLDLIHTTVMQPYSRTISLKTHKKVQYTIHYILIIVNGLLTAVLNVSAASKALRHRSYELSPFDVYNDPKAMSAPPPIAEMPLSLSNI